MNAGIETRLLDIPSIFSLEPTYLINASEKWLVVIVVVNKARKDQTRKVIDTVSSEALFPDSKIERPGRSNIHNINSSLSTYDVALQNNPHLLQ